MNIFSDLYWHSTMIKENKYDILNQHENCIYSYMFYEKFMDRYSFSCWFRISHLFWLIIRSYQCKWLKMFIFYWKIIKKSRKIQRCEPFFALIWHCFSNIFYHFVENKKLHNIYKNLVLDLLNLQQSRSYTVLCKLIKMTPFHSCWLYKT